MQPQRKDPFFAMYRISQNRQVNFFPRDASSVLYCRISAPTDKEYEKRLFDEPDTPT
jgi:hypothetical protein